jgi:hypothetical protein
LSKTEQLSRPESRLAISQCRVILGDAARDLSDQQVEALRDQLYAIATVSRQAFWAAKQLPFDLALGLLPVAEREEVEERAAIAEFEGKLSRDQAERLALVPKFRSTRTA